MLNALDVIRANPTSRSFVIGDLVFARFTCPALETPLGIWSHTDHFLHVLSARTSWTTADGPGVAVAGETVFFKKGAFVMPPHVETDLCVLLFFVPDDFVRVVVRELAADLPAASMVAGHPLVVPVQPDPGVSAFLHSMQIYFAAAEPPPEALLKMKLKELLAGILLSPRNQPLSAYLRSLAGTDAPAIPTIMEENFCHNLPIEAFARLCHRSLSAFKREFRQHYGMSPGEWLRERRLACAAQLLHATDRSVTEIMLDCGFAGPAHFSRAFKQTYGVSPREFRKHRPESVGAVLSARPRAQTDHARRDRAACRWLR